MANQVKEQAVQDLNGKFQKAVSAVLVDYCGLTGNEMGDLRSRLRAEGVEMIVVKNTLAKRASEGTQFDSVKEHIVGPTSVAISYEEATAPAKVLMTYLKESANIKIKAGVVEGKALSVADIKALSELPSKEVLLAQVLSTMNAPVTNFVGVLGGVLRKLLYVLKAVEKTK